MNQLCKVCGELAAGFHFGAFTCEGCKSFFGRTYTNQATISKCKNHYKCIITKTNRTTCKECRLKKCLLVGMSKNGSRYGRRSNWFKIHCLLNEQNAGDDDLKCFDMYSSSLNDYLFTIKDINYKEDGDIMIKREFDPENYFWPINETAASKAHDFIFSNTKTNEQIEPIDLSLKLKQTEIV